VETAIFRGVREGLTNIPRHSESAVARVRVASSGGTREWKWKTRAKGTGPQKPLEIISNGLPGVGVRGRRETLRQRVGSFEPGPAGEGQGTVVVARLPITDRTCKLLVTWRRAQETSRPVCRAFRGISRSRYIPAAEYAILS
jgi:signal transduction histidine kinase